MNDSIDPDAVWWKTVLQASLITGTFTVISSLTTGYQYGLSNNLFHIPYVLRLAEQPEFRHDVLYNSLTNYTSIIWPALRLISNEQNIQTVFFTAFVIIRFLTFYVIYFFITANATSSRKTLVACLTLGVIVACPWAIGVSTIGGHGLLINYFTQTETTWPLIFIGLLCLQQRSLGKAGLAFGAIFSINAFVGVWLVWTALFTKLFARIDVSRSDMAKGVLSFLVFAGPVMFWVVSTGSIENSDADFSYVEYARIYNPYHYLIEASSAAKVLRYLLLIAAGLLACCHLPGTRYWIAVQASLLGFFLIGALLPYLVDNKFVIILHFLRSDGVAQFLAVLLICTAAANLLFSAESRQKTKVLAIFILLLLIAPYPSHSGLDMAFIVLAFLLTLYKDNHGIEHEARARKFISSARVHLLQWQLELIYGIWGFATIVCGGLTPVVAAKISVFGLTLAFARMGFAPLSWRQFRILATTMIIALCGWTTLLSAKAARQFSYDESSLEAVSLEQMTDWIRQSSFQGPFLVRANEWGDRFQLLARRTVWVDWKQGGAIPWAPDFYQQWSSRYAEVSQLRSPDDFLAYAKKNKIQNVVLDSDGANCPLDATAEQRFGRFTFCHLPMSGIASSSKGVHSGTTLSR